MKLIISPLISLSLLPSPLDKEDSLGKDADNGLDFGPHHSDAATVCRHELGTGGEDLIALGHYWHPGRLIYYNRAELKQSDHRLVHH